LTPGAILESWMLHQRTTGQYAGLAKVNKLAQDTLNQVLAPKQTTTKQSMKTKSTLGRLTLCGLFCLYLSLVVVPATVWADGVGDQTKATVAEMTDAVKEAGHSAADSFKSLWNRVDLTNRNRDEIVAWVIMGMLVGAIAGMFTGLKTSGAGRLGRLMLGLGGALLGGSVVHVARLDFGWGPVLVRYEELLFSMAGAIFLIVVARLIHSSFTKKKANK
jgi:uncharacterized membrane protein YeaQ/YmgE (transglycosylase-associated protein family)